MDNFVDNVHIGKNLLNEQNVSIFCISSPPVFKGAFKNSERRTKLSLTCRETFWIRKASAFRTGGITHGHHTRRFWGLHPLIESQRDPATSNLHIVLCALLPHQPHTNVQALASWLTAIYFWHLLGISSSRAQSPESEI